MDLHNIWSVSAKDFSIFTKKKYIFYSIVIVPLVIAIGFPTIIWYVQSRGKLTPKAVQDLVPAFSFFFVALASLVPTVLASYSLVGEKVEKSLEPLLATPLTDGEILSGKMFAAFLPTLVAMYIGISIF